MISSGTLPGGLIFNSNNGTITGTPTTAGTNNVLVAAANSVGLGSNGIITFQIAKASNVITFNTGIPRKTIGDAPFAVTATASSGLPVTFASGNTNIATVSSNTVTVVGVGTTTIIASQGGNENFAAATDVSQVLVVSPAGLLAWDFGTASPSSPGPGNITSGDLSQGNNNGTTVLIGSTSPSSGYSGASGGNNAGASARTGVLNTAANGSAYFEFTLTPVSGFTATVTDLSFGSRATPTGPTAYSLRSSVDNYATDLLSGTQPATSTWSLLSHTNLTLAVNLPTTFRLYGHSGTGSATASTANWRIDDLVIALQVVAGTNPILSATPSSISGLSATAGTAGAASSYVLTGTNLTGDVTVTPSSGLIEISTNSSTTGFTNSLTLSRVGAATNAVSNTVFVRISSAATATNALAASVRSVSSGVTNTVNVSGTVTAPVAKTITLASSLTNLVEGRDGNWSGAAPDDYTKYEAVLTITRTDTTSAVQVDLSSSSPNQVGVLNTNAPAVFPIVYSNLPTTVNFGVGVATQTFYLAPVNNTNGTGNRSVIVTASAASAGYTPGNFTYNIAEDDPYITNSILNLTGKVGQPIDTYTIQAANSPTSFEQTGLPAGLTLNMVNGQITGTPTEAATNKIVQISAKTSIAGGSTNLIVNVSQGTPSLTGSPSAGAITQGQSLSSSAITATVNPAGGQWTWSSPSTVPPLGTNTYSAVYSPATADQPNWTTLTSNVSVVVNPAGSGPTLIAEDKADNYGGGGGKPDWTNSANAGFGFTAWDIASGTTTNGFAGNFTGDPTAAGITGFGTNAFGLYANPADNANFVAVKRAFSTPLAVGQTFSFQWALNWDTGGIGNKGFVIKAGGINGTTLVNVNQGDFPGNITLGGANTGLASGTGPMTWAFRLVNSNTLQVSSTARDGSTSPVYTTNLTVSGAPDAFEFYASGLSAVDGNNRQPYFNNFQIWSGSGGGGGGGTTTFAGWSGGVTLTNTNLHLLTKYAIGGASSAAANDGVANVVGQTNVGGTNFLVLRAFVRTNDSKLQVGGEAGTSLAAGTQWTNPVFTNAFTPTGTPPAGTTPREYRTVQDTNTRKFLRLKATLAP